MINRLRRKFILICAASIFAVILLIFAVIAGLNLSSLNRTMDMLTDGLSEGNGRFPDSFGDRQPKPERPEDKNPMEYITPETRYSTRHFTVWMNAEGEVTRVNTEFIYTVSETDAKEMAQRAISGSALRGWLSHYRYKIYADQSETAVVFVDGSMNRSSLLQSLTIAGAVLVSAATVVLLLIALLSGRVMKPIAESYERQKQFVTDANHELKSPLTLILTNLDIAEAELGKNEWLSDIRSEGQRMSTLVNQLVALSRMDEEARPISRTELSVSDIVQDTVSEFATFSKSRGKPITAHIQADVRYAGDEVLIRRLISILMDNAVKYCDEGGNITVMLQQRRHITLTVENTYAAVDEVALDRLFDRFYRADKARTYTGGFGIGLSIAKSIVEKHHGELSAFKKDHDHIGFKVVL